MKTFLTSVLLIIAFITNAQSLTGKWKPVFFSLDTIIRVDITTDSIYMNPSMKDQFKDDKDPAASIELMKYVAESILESMKHTNEEYTEDNNPLLNWTNFLFEL